MANDIQLKRSSVSGRVPGAANVLVGEPVVNLADRVIYTKNTTGTVIVIGAGTTSNITEGSNLYFSNARVSTAISSQTLGNATFSSDVNVRGELFVTGASGDEGGQISLALPVSNTSLSGQITIDVNQNRLRIFEKLGTNRGVYIDLSTAAAGAGTSLLGGSGTITSVAGITSGAVSNAQLAAATVTSQTLSNATFSANVTADKVISVNNGNSENYRVGDDIWIGDYNISNSMKLKGVQDPTRAFISFGTSDTATLGRSGTGALTYTAGFEAANVVSTGNISAGNAAITNALTAGTLQTTGNINANNLRVVTNSSVGNVVSGTWQGGSISTTYTDAKVTSVNGQTGAATGFATTANSLSQFASTTSAQLATLISDETGSGSLVFATAPTLVTPVLGLATGTSVMLSANIGAAAGNVSGNFTAGNFQTTGAINAASGVLSSSSGRLIFGTDSGGSISLGNVSNLGASTPYIDFNSGATTVDYDSRILGSGGNGVAGNGTLTFTAAASAFTGNISAGNAAVTSALTAGTLQTAGNVNAAAGRISGNFSTTGVLRVADTTPTTGAGTGAAIISGGASVGGNLYVSGNLFVAGTTTSVNSNVITLQDSLIFLADNSTTDVLDLGFVATFNNGVQQHTGLVRDASDGVYKLFANVVSEPNVNGTVDFTNAVYSPLTMGALNASTGTFSSTVSATSSNVNSQSGLVTGSLTAGTLQTTGNVNANNLRVVTNSSLGTVQSGTWNGSSISTTYTDAKVTSVNGQTGAATGFATTANNLSQFASTTSAQLATLISDETGSGSLVFATTPTLVTPVLGLATGTSVMLSANIGAAAGNVSGNFSVGGSFVAQTGVAVPTGAFISVAGPGGGTRLSRDAGQNGLDIQTGSTSRLFISDADGNVIVRSTTNSTSNSTGALIVAGGVGISGNVAAANVVITSTSRLGTITSGTWNGSTIGTAYTTAKVTSVAGQTGAVTNAELLSSITDSGVLTTANVTEVTNLYFTNARSRTAISTTGTKGSYSNSTGVFNFTNIANVTVAANAPSSPNIGDQWIDSETGSTFLYFNDGTSSQWVEQSTGTIINSSGGSGSGGGGLAANVFFENSLEIAENYTITAGKSAMSTGPITISDGVAVTVPAGSRWVVL